MIDDIIRAASDILAYDFTYCNITSVGVQISNNDFERVFGDCSYYYLEGTMPTQKQIKIKGVTFYTLVDERF